MKTLRRVTYLCKATPCTPGWMNIRNLTRNCQNLPYLDDLSTATCCTRLATAFSQFSFSWTGDLTLLPPLPRDFHRTYLSSSFQYFISRYFVCFTFFWFIPYGFGFGLNVPAGSIRFLSLQTFDGPGWVRGEITWLVSYGSRQTRGCMEVYLPRGFDTHCLSLRPPPSRLPLSPPTMSPLGGIMETPSVPLISPKRVYTD